MGKKNKSKAPRGRAAAKQKAKKGNSSGGGGGGGGGGASWASRSAHMMRRMQMGDDDDDDDFDTSGPMFRGFQQQQQQNNTPRKNFTPINPGVKLRHQKIAFVSAGTNTPAEPESKEEEEEGAFEAADDSEEDGVDSEGEEVDDSNIQSNMVTDTDVEISEGAIAHMNIQSSGEMSGAETANTTSDADMADADNTPQPAAKSPEQPLFVVDTTGDSSLAGPSKGGKMPVRREPSPAPSDSDSGEEVIVFHGRKQPQGKAQAKPAAASVPSKSQPGKPSSAPIPQQSSGHGTATAKERQTEESKKDEAPMMDPEYFSRALPARDAGSSFSTPSASSPRDAIGWAAAKSKLDRQIDESTTWAPAPAGSWWKKGKPRPDLDPSPAEKKALENTPPRVAKVGFVEPKAEDEPTAEESIAALQSEVRAIYRANNKLRQDAREPDKIDLKSPKSKRHGKRGRKKDNRALRGPTSEDEDDDGEAAYDDYMSNLAAQIEGTDSGGDDGQVAIANSSFKGVDGPSLVIDGEEIADDEKLPSHFEMMNEDYDSDESDDGSIGQDLSDESDFNSSDFEAELDYNEQEQWEDEEDLRRRARARKTDEQIAKLFAKQQELGYDCEELIFDDGEYMSISEDVEGVGDVASARAGLSDISNFTSGRRSSGRRNITFPDASAMADTVEQYGENGFDIMDFDRPSLRPKKKGRKGKLPPELEALSDDDLRENVLDAWENDRAKKSLKKAEREAQRADGMLGSSGRQGKADLSVKYPNGMSTRQIHQELRAFLLDGNQTSRPFPPMDKLQRKDLHEIANVLNLKSKSIGSGKARFPNLVKTARTPVHGERIDRALELSQKGMLGRDVKWGRKKGGGKAKSGGGGGLQGANKSAASVKHGEVVGAGAAEIGASSYGHRLMEKMGWSKGMALGKEGEGRLVPVEQVVKLGTAGLG